MNDQFLRETSITELSLAIKSHKISPVELTKSCLDRIQRLNPVLNAFINVFDEDAVKQAQAMESEILDGNWRGPLHGVPIALKDIIDVAGFPTTAASGACLHRVPKCDAPVVSKLREAGVVLLGKLNLHEFAYGGSGLLGYFGPVRNPRNTAYITGGSSSGSAAAVAAGLCFAALGTDTAGSIRLPASYCGIVGLKPTYCAVSTSGVVPLSWSYDHVGPMTRTVADAALVFQAIAENKNLEKIDSSGALAKTFRSSQLKIGIARECFFEELDKEVEQAITKAISLLQGMVKSLSEVKLTVENDRSVINAEAYAFHHSYIEGHAREYHPETLRRIRTGEAVTTVTYIHKKRALDKLRATAAELFSEVDLVLTPTSPVLPLTISQLEAEPDQLRGRELKMLRNTRPFNALGVPTISVPCGVSSSGLPIGLQIAGPPGGEDKVLSLAYAYEQATQWPRSYNNV